MPDAEHPKCRVYFDHRPEIRPALDFVLNKAYITIPMDIDVSITRRVKGEDIITGVKKAKRLVTITSDKEMLPTTEESFMKRGLSMIGTVSVPRRRWSLDSVHNFITEGDDKTTFWGTFGMIRQRYKHYMDLGSDIIYSFISLWVMGGYFFPLFVAYPYTYFGGIRESGKTKMLTLTQQMAFNAISSGNISTSSIFRMIEGSRATLLIDEAEKLGSTDRAQEFKNILNASYKPGNPVFRAEKTAKEQFIVVDFDAYSPKMLANIAGLEDVLESRVIPFTMRRTLDNEIANREIDTNEETWQYIRDKLYLLAMLKWKEVKHAYSQVEPVEGITARNWEIWRPIVALARVTDNTARLEAEILNLAREKSQEKLLESTVEAGDSVLIKVLIDLVTYENYYTVKEIKSRMIDSYGEAYKWLNSEWIGRAMKRQDFKEKRRLGTGMEYRLNSEIVRMAAKRMNIDVNSEGNEGSESKQDIDMNI